MAANSEREDSGESGDVSAISDLPPAPETAAPNTAGKARTPASSNTTSATSKSRASRATNPAGDAASNKNQSSGNQPPQFPAPDLNPSQNAPNLEQSDPTQNAPNDAQPVIATAQNEPLRVLAARKGLALPLPQARVVIYKSQRRLDIMSSDTLVKSYRVALGQNPVGHKQKQGDSRTPEGRFYICTRNASTSAFHIFLGLSYPALPDAKRAVNNKQITWREYQIINQRLASRGRPPWETKLGGWVGIHGGSDDAFAKKKMAERGSRDWTAGCIALNNREIEEIYAATKLGTPVDVKP